MNDRHEALRLRWDRKDDVDESELAQLRQDTDPEIRRLATRITFEQTMRSALDAVANSLAAEARFDAEADWVSRGAQLARYDEPVPFMLKQIGIATIARGDLDMATTLLFNALVWAMRQGQSGDERSRRLMRYAIDPDFDSAFEAIAARISMPRYYRPKAGKRRVAVVIPFDRDGNSVGIVTAGITVGLCERGVDAFIVSTRMLNSPPDTVQRKNLDAAGSRIVEAEGASALERTLWLLDYFEREPVDAVIYFSDPQDVVPRLCEIIGLANVQIFVNAAYEHFSGRLDAIIHTIEPQQIESAVRPDIGLFIPTGIARDRVIAEAAPARRSDFGVPDDAIVLTTFARLSKLTQRGFLDAVAMILREEPKAIWLVAGAGSAEEFGTIRDTLTASRVEDRVNFLGTRSAEIPSLLRMTDIYLDPFPFPGAQSTGEAMFAGLPVVSMLRARDADLDSTGSGVTTAAGEAMIGDAAPMAPADDIEGYAALAIRYIRDSEERRRVGMALKARAERELSVDVMIDRYRDAIERAIGERAPVRDGELAVVIVVPSPLVLERVVARINSDRGLYAPNRILIVINGDHPDLETRARRYGDRVVVVRLPEEVARVDAIRAGIQTAGAPLCAILDDTALPIENWAAEGVAAARARGYGRVRGGVVLATDRAATIEEALAALAPMASPSVPVPASPPASEEFLLGLRDRYEAHAYFNDGEVAALCEHSDSRVRTLGHRVVFEKEAGPAFKAAVELASIDDAMAEDLIGYLTGALSARQPEAYVGAMKLRARRAFARGDLEETLKAIANAIAAGMTAAQMGVKRWHPLFHVANDPDFDELFAEVAAKVSPPRVYPPRDASVRRFAIVVSVDLAANSLSLTASRAAVGLRALGHEICYVSTEFYKSPKDMPTAISVQAVGAEVIFAEGETLLDRVQDLLERFSRKPVDAAMYFVDPADPIARILEIVGLSNAQALVTAGFDQRSGRIDTYVHTVQPAQVETAMHPERSVYIPTGIARDREVMSARPVLRSEIDLKPDDIVLCTIGRLNKAVQREFLEAIFGALRQNKRLKWLVLGPREEHSLKVLDRAMGAAGVGGQVQWPGAIHDRLPSFLLSADIYCDTFPFPGGQSLGEAMFAALPVVAMRRVVDVDLDPSGTGPTSATAEVFIGDAVELTQAGDVTGYTNRILEYAANPDLRKRDGARLRERAIATLGFEKMLRAYGDLLEKLADRPVPVG